MNHNTIEPAETSLDVRDHRTYDHNHSFHRAASQADDLTAAPHLPCTAGTAEVKSVVSRNIEAAYTPHGTPIGLAEQTIRDLKQTFASIGHVPTPDMWTALESVAKTMERMATRSASPVIYLSSLDPGVGKTSTVIHFMRSLLRSSDHSDTSVLLCVGRREQIKTIVAEAALSDDDFAVLTADPALNQLGSGKPDRARILFTTHSMIERRCEDRSFASASAFHFRGHIRDVRIWDEAILPGRALTISRDDLGFLFKPLRSRHASLTTALEELFTKLGETPDGTLMPIPDLAEVHRVHLNDALQIVEGGPVDQVTAVETLWFLFGKTVTIRRDGVFGNTILDYKDTLPDDIRPLLALDASARVRTAYDLWRNGRGGVEMLPSATKRYDRHTCYVWNHAGGKSAFRRHANSLIDGIVRTIQTRPSEEWLVVHHKSGAGIDLPSAVSALLPEDGPQVHFLNWGSHDATNAYASVPNVILAGTLFYRTSYYEALGRMAAGHPSSNGVFPEDERQAVMIGENCHLVLQALCRGAVRRCENGGCPETRTYIIAADKTGIPAELNRLFPGARIKPWRPIQTNLLGNVGKAFAYIKQRIAEDPNALVSFKEVKEHIGCRDQSNFNRVIRRHEDFRQALADESIIEWGVGRRFTGFQASKAVFGAN